MNLAASDFFGSFIMQKKQATTSQLFKVEIYHYTKTRAFSRKYYILTSFKDLIELEKKLLQFRKFCVVPKIF